MGGRTRLDMDVRRQQLVEVGRELFAKRPYDEVWVEEIASAAGVSRGLLYHYFPTKRDFFVEVVRAQVDHIAELTAPDLSKPPLEGLRETLDAYLRYVEENAQGYISIHRAGIGSDAEIRAILEESYARDVDRILQRITAGGAAPAIVRVAVRGWLAFTIGTVIDWIEHPTIERDELRELLVQAMKGCVTAAMEVEPGTKLPGIQDDAGVGAEAAR
ncbi:MAG: TetR/AcrR family transcriptional regulator [Actinobacteria bacterium]|nr:TetR/AcrR family transcriptional regulator [Actinomycetota bacterium]